MTDLNLYRFISDNKVEYHWHDDDVIIFVNFDNIKAFCHILGSHALDEEGIEVRLKDGYIAIWMKNLCENEDVIMTEVFDKNN